MIEAELSLVSVIQHNLVVGGGQLLGEVTGSGGGQVQLLHLRGGGQGLLPSDGGTGVRIDAVDDGSVDGASNGLAESLLDTRVLAQRVSLSGLLRVEDHHSDLDRGDRLDLAGQGSDRLQATLLDDTGGRLANRDRNGGAVNGDRDTTGETLDDRALHGIVPDALYDGLGKRGLIPRISAENLGYCLDLGFVVGVVRGCRHMPSLLVCKAEEPERLTQSVILGLKVCIHRRIAGD